MEPERCERQERKDADPQTLTWGAWAPHRHRSPNPSWIRHPGLLELSLKPRAGSKGDPGETRSSGGQEVLQSLEAIKDQTPSRQGGVTQGAGSPSPAARTAGLAFRLRSRPIFRGGLFPLNRSRASPLLLFLPPRLPLPAFLSFGSQPLRHSSPLFQVSRLYNWSLRVAPGRALEIWGKSRSPHAHSHWCGEELSPGSHRATSHCQRCSDAQRRGPVLFLLSPALFAFYSFPQWVFPPPPIQE